MAHLTSRPEEEESISFLDELDQEEMELIAALLYNVRLGSGISPWTDAAFTLMEKIAEYTGDDTFIEDSASNVHVVIDHIDKYGRHINTLGPDEFEIQV